MFATQQLFETLSSQGQGPVTVKTESFDGQILDLTTVLQHQGKFHLSFISDLKTSCFLVSPCRKYVCLRK